MLENMRNTVQDNIQSWKEYKIQVDNEIKTYRVELVKFRQDFFAFAKKEEFEKTNKLVSEIRVSFITQYELMRSELKQSLGRIDSFGKNITTLTSEMKMRDEALKRVPANIH